MKKYLLIPLLLLLVYTAKAQIIISLLLGDKLNSNKVEFGLDGGWNWSAIKNLENAKTLGTFNLGFYFDIKLKNPSWMLNTGVIVKSTMGANKLPVYATGDPNLDSVFRGGSVTRKISYFNVPIMMKYKFKNHIYVKAGIQLGLKYNASDEFKNEVHKKDDLKYSIKIKDQFNPIDAGLVAGLGYRLMKGNGMNIGIQYYYGLVNIMKDNSSFSQFNRSFYVTVGIPIGVGKKKEALSETKK